MEMRDGSALYIVIPAYNEAENIRKTIQDWYFCVENYGGLGSRLLVIDDGSTDETYAIMREEQKNKPLFLALTRENSGHGATVLYGYHYALDHGADFIFQTDSDGQTLPNEFGKFWEERNSYDMITGHRLNRQDGCSRKFVSWILKLILWLVFSVEVKDANTPFRLMKASALRQYIEKVPKDYHLVNVLLSVIYIRYGQKVKYLPISFLPRQGGKNSINFNRIFKIGWKAWREFRELDKQI